MRVVGIRQLKARLSEYLREVRRGEVFLVTDRDRVVAELRPPGPHAPGTADDLDRTMDLLFQSGDVQPPRAAKSDWVWRPAGLGLPRGTSARLLNDIRSDR